MSLKSRKPRPIKRDAESLRDDRLFIIACDDTYAPKQYFDAYRLRGVQIAVVEARDGKVSARHVLERILAHKDLEEDDERWMLLDTDHYIKDNHFPSFIEAISEARQQGIRVALSRPSFEVWLLLHHVAAAEIENLTDAKAVEKRLKEVLGSYNKTNLDSRKFPLELVPPACRKAEERDATVPGGDRPERNTTRVYQLWYAILSKALPSQLPDGLKEMLQDNQG